MSENEQMIHIKSKSIPSYDIEQQEAQQNQSLIKQTQRENGKIKQIYQEPDTHRQNRSTWEWLFGSCMSRTYDLDQQEIQAFGMLKEDTQQYFDEKNQTHIMILAELWELLTETAMDKENYKNEEWIKYGFQNKNPCTDFRGGGVLSLLQIIHFTKNNKELVIKDMSNPQNDFFFALSSINVTFFLKQILHLAEHLDPKKDRNVFCDRQSFKSFCQMLVKDDDTFNKMHDIVLKDMFNSWIALRKSQPKTTLIDFPKIEQQFKKKFRNVLSRQEYFNITEFERAFKALK
ncbi:ELMO/CED-12 family protein (macronuclear) [Tetrahymena thermophila SB210]|uniref:ELMO/CED-12 family protein n=1 Tax=Tetrahymena thermophila (strain SB210) TaxID=312017 RepID=I7MAX8_TETTS|nr:ELMO/CED-12 family protein [Tetrahymena thermophila SB210]EAS06689.2 ELMO/CED-12 family protein [Tetrahymena thermophila SB210]|eukprot:XP_001026931.2 ELMO/CED-12 family protein [Tetrahymena thermophila SB210]